ncbi:LuxR C-terminal-related transcriptional regulator [Myroides sp. M-43]|uniref:LuxR C-terminal-related transcriptional regulator n=1 Tax=Myroides oncorhynchi TaxID=2893756 RepID=UPI001E399930|nr:LuxR C-terminal-related transcriptional regulator [Myroides oncorhynchi]MCC9043291.1 LuxR C-terminal-related transcriptional regulator [Myroides oncorhynchi]
MSTNLLFRIVGSIFLFCCIGKCFSQSYNFEEISKDVTSFNNVGKYDDTIILLEEVIANEKATADEKYQAYFLKYITYKRLFSYDKAQANLELAFQEGLKSNQNREQIKAKVKLERLFVAFDLLKFDEVISVLDDITEQDLRYISPNTHAFYLAVLAVMQSKAMNFSKAIEYLDEAIILLEENKPEDLPLMYRKKIDIYRQMNQYDKALESFDQGLYYAKKYNMDIYILNMYYDLAYFYNQIQDYDNAIITQEICNLLAKQYDERTVIGRLNVLEKELYANRIESEKHEDLLSIALLVVISLLVIAILYLLYKYTLKTKQRKETLESKNDELRVNIMSLLSESNQQPHNDPILQLTERQSDIVKLVKEGKTNKEIGDKIHISENTVKYHLKNIYKVLSVNSREEL